ncbi:murein hydrolase activator EnvC family protein [Neomegalonema perideroedes]|uniref:murein hydrolase activator EnvC family protein n=1 Tax=Neomegalonema perideroedes TaxID=217219 RepID=UPI00037BBDB2|nr:peptidoglycan DD-metalloendopeptidase family protein [Neomegalonema perideroedes]
MTRLTSALALPFLLWPAFAGAQTTPADLAAQAQAQAAQAAQLAAEAEAAAGQALADQARIDALEAALRASQDSAEDARERLTDLTRRQYEAEDQLHRRKAEHAAAFGAMISLAKAPAPALAAYSDRPAQAARAASALSGLAEALERDARQMRDEIGEIGALRRETQAARAEALERIEAVRLEDGALKEALRESRGRGALAGERAEKLRQESEDLNRRAADLQAAMAQAAQEQARIQAAALAEAQAAAQRAAMAQAQAAMALAPQPSGNPRRLPSAEPAPGSGSGLGADLGLGFSPPPPGPAPLAGPAVETAYASPPRETVRQIYEAPPQNLGAQRARTPVMGARLMARYGDRLSNGHRSDGLHFEAEAGSLVYAPFAGVVEFAGPMKNLSNVVMLRVDRDHHVLLAGLGDLDPKILGRKGVQLAAGESLGRLSAPHEGRTLAGFYLELRRGDAIADPSPWFGDLNER